MAKARQFVSITGTVLVTVAVWAGSTQSAFAAPFVVTPMRESGVAYGLGCEDPEHDQCSQGLTAFLTDGAGTRLERSGTRSLLNGAELTFSGLGESSFGILRAAASAEFVIPDGTPTSAFAAAWGEFVDVLTIDGGALNGQAGQLNAGFTIDGLVDKAGAGNAFAGVVVSAGDQPTEEESPWRNPEHSGFYIFETSVGQRVALDPIDFVFGQPFYLRFFMLTLAGTVEYCETCAEGIGFPNTSGSGSGSTLFGNTLVLSQLVPTIGGNPVSDVQFSSASGTRYTSQGVVPEPGSVFLLGGGIIALSLRRRRR